MPRPMWKGAISFGLVNIPVELYPAEERKGFSFSMLDKNDLSLIGYKRFNKSTGKEVEWGDVIKGYEYKKDQYVVLSQEDFRRANVKGSQTVDIKAFVPADEIPAHFYETPYYLAPGQRGEKVYALLRETLLSMRRVAVAQVVIRTTQHLAAVVAKGKVLMLITLRYADELRATSGLELPSEGLKGAGVTPKEIELAKRLIEDMSGHWDPSEFKDTYHDDLMRRIDEKIKAGETAVITEPEKGEKASRQTAQVIDLMELLKQSLGGDKKARKQSARAQNDDDAGEEDKLKTAAKRAKPPARTSKSATSASTSVLVQKAPAKRKRA